MAPPNNGYFPDFGYIGIGVQAAVGTAVPPVRWIALNSMTGGPTFMSKYTRDGLSRDNSVTFKNEQHWKGSFSTYLSPDTAAYLLGLALSGGDVVSGSTDPYTHTINTANQLLYPFTIEQGWGMASTSSYIGIRRITDCYMTGAKLSWAGGTEPTIAFTYEGITEVIQAGPTTVVFDADRYMANGDAAFTVTGFANNGTGFAVMKGDIDIKNAPNITPRGDSIAPLILPGGRDIDLSLDIAVKDDLVARDIGFGADAGTAASKLLFNMTTFVAKWDLAGAPDHFLQLTLNNSKMDAYSPQFSKDGKIFLMSGVHGKATAITGGTVAATLVASNNRQTAFWS